MSNPFEVAAAVGAARRALAELDAKQRALAAGAHVVACETIMKHAVLRRAEMACEAALAWDPDAKVTGVFQTQTHTGVLHLRVKFEMRMGHPDGGVIEFIASPKSNLIACEGRKGNFKHRWPKVAITAEGISEHVDKALAEFLAWHP